MTTERMKETIVRNEVRLTLDDLVKIQKFVVTHKPLGAITINSDVSSAIGSLVTVSCDTIHDGDEVKLVKMITDVSSW